jgi:predicted nucleotidyltransferase
MSALGRALSSLVQFLNIHQVPYMVIGGLANVVWGEPRTTLDVDLSVLVEERAWPRMIAELRKGFRVIPSDPFGFIQETHVLPLETEEGVRIDLVWAVLPYEHQAIRRALTEEVAGSLVKVCRPEDLIIHKVVAARVKDQEDVRGIIRHLKGRLDRRYLIKTVRSLSTALDQPELLTFLKTCLDQPRKRGESRR